MHIQNSVVRATSKVAVLGLLAGGLVMIAPSVASAQTINVTTTVDGDPGSLRDAIDTINTTGGPGPNIINLVAGETYVLDDCASGLIRVDSGTGALTINGNGATIEQTCTNQRILRYNSSELLTLNEVTMTGADYTGNAGAIKSFGPVTVNDSSFIDNSASGNGGGIWADNQNVTITGSTFTENRTGGGGGAVYVGDGTITVANSTFEANGATFGGALSGRRVDVSYATFWGNEAGETGSAISSDEGSVFATVLADAATENCRGSITSEGYNWSDDVSCNLTMATDTEDVGGDPGLAALADNGGPTATMLPEPGSPLLDAIPASVSDCTRTDQRGVTRPQNGACDIGAVEVAVVVPPTVPTTAAPTTTAAPAANAAQATPRFTG